MSTQEPSGKEAQYKEVRSMLDFAIVISFFDAFGERIGIRNVSAEDLENALINSESSALVYTVHKNLLKELGKKIGADNWQRYLRREFIRRKSLNDVLGEYPFTDDEQVIAEDLANQPLFKKRKLDHIPSDDVENIVVNKEKSTINTEKKESKKNSQVKEEPKETKKIEKIDPVTAEEKKISNGQTENKLKSDNNDDNSNSSAISDNNNKKSEKTRQNNNNETKNGNNNKPVRDSDRDEISLNEEDSDSDDKEFNADVSQSRMQDLQREDDELMDEDQYVDDNEDIEISRKSTRLSKKFSAVEDPDLVRRSNRLTKRKREDDSNTNNDTNKDNNEDKNGDGSGSGDEGSEEEKLAAAKKMINSYYHALLPKTKVLILRNLCEWIIDKPSDKLQKEAKKLSEEDMQRLRPDPIFIDEKKGDNYWYFGGVNEERIYREHVEEHEYKHKNSADLLEKDAQSAVIEWNTLTASLNDVKELMQTIESDNKAKQLKEFINEEVLPPLLAKHRKKEQAARRAAQLDMGLNRTNILRETRTRRRAATDAKCIYDIDSVLDWDNLK